MAACIRVCLYVSFQYNTAWVVDFPKMFDVLPVVIIILIIII